MTLEVWTEAKDSGRWIKVEVQSSRVRPESVCVCVQVKTLLRWDGDTVDTTLRQLFGTWYSRRKKRGSESLGHTGRDVALGQTPWGETDKTEKQEKRRRTFHLRGPRQELTTHYNRCKGKHKISDWSLRTSRRTSGAYLEEDQSEWP